MYVHEVLSNFTYITLRTFWKYIINIGVFLSYIIPCGLYYVERFVWFKASDYRERKSWWTGGDTEIQAPGLCKNVKINSNCTGKLQYYMSKKSWLMLCNDLLLYVIFATFTLIFTLVFNLCNSVLLTYITILVLMWTCTIADSPETGMLVDR